MSKFIGVKMIEAVSMTAREANDEGHRIGNHFFEEDGYEVTYPNAVSYTHLTLPTNREV